MGMLGKIRDLFTEEEIDEPIKKEVIQVEIPAPKKVEKKEEITDSEALKCEEKASPVFFNDNDFEDIDIVKEVPKKSRSSYLKEKKKEEEKRFRPTPIISPVYGVLDKNYKKDDITDRKRDVISQTNTSEISIDEIRKKAFGTLEDDLEKELFSSNTVLFNEEMKEEKLPDDCIDIFEQMESDVTEEYYPEETVETRSSRYDKYEEEPKAEKIVTKPEKTIEDDLFDMVDQKNEKIEEDLFNLIDSMYEKGDDE